MSSIGNRVTPSLFTPDIAATLSFYREVLGFRLSGCHPNEASARWIELTRDGIVLWFYSSPSAGVSQDTALSGVLYLFPESVTELADELSGAVELEWGPEVMPYGFREIAIRDCNGYLLAFAEPA